LTPPPLLPPPPPPPALQTVKKGSLPCIAISSERRQGNKRVTRIAGLEAFLVDPEEAAGACQRRFACSSTVAELPGKGAGHEVVIQGNVIDEVADWVMKTYAVPKKYFQVKK
jgi:translation initiation factor 2D